MTLHKDYLLPVNTISNYFSFSDATSANEAVNLQNRLRTLSSGLVGLRNCIHDQQQNNGASTMEVGVSMADSGMTRMPDSTQPNSSLHPDPLSFPQVPNDGSALINGNGTLLSNIAGVPPLPNSSSNALTTSTTSFHENGANHVAQNHPQPHFVHGKLIFKDNIEVF